jgi:predicted N-acyltransferase
VDLPALHFEAAYYQGIEFCIRNGIDVFESGAQGEHKISRGFMPERTASFHYLREEGFRAAIAQYLERERAVLDEYRQEVAQHDPFRAEPA